MVDWLRFAVAAVLFLGGLYFILTGIVGTFRFRYVLNRLHAAAIIDTLGLFLCMAALIVTFGFSLASVKLLCAVVFMWLTSPISAHLITRLQLMLEEEPSRHMEIRGADDEEEGEEQP